MYSFIILFIVDQRNRILRAASSLILYRGSGVQIFPDCMLTIFDLLMLDMHYFPKPLHI